jgi:hypothetical protein
MKTISLKNLIRALLILSLLCNCTTTLQATTRILESEFRLARQLNSEFSAKFSVFSAGRILVEAICQNLSAEQVRLRLVLIRPDKTEFKSEGFSPLKVEHSFSAQELDNLLNRRATQWTAKILNLENSSDSAMPIVGRLKITVPAATRILEETQFTLQGFRNAQSIPFKVQGPGKLIIEVNWQADSSDSKETLPLHIGLIHESQNKIYASKTGTKNLRIEHQVSEQDLDRGSNWAVKITNNNLVGVRGKMTARYTPSL